MEGTYFQGRGVIFAMKYFANTVTGTFPVENGIISTSVGGFEVDKIKNNLFGSTQSNILSADSIFHSVQPFRCSLS